MSDPGADAVEQLSRLGATEWWVMRDVAVRGAGFPAALLNEICDEELSRTADQVAGDDLDERYQDAYRRADHRLRATTAGIAADPVFREAVAWQNPGLVETCLDKIAAGSNRSVHRGRRRELTLASYLQRYCLKNDTVGFFGPVGWARVEDRPGGIDVTAGPGLLSRRTTYFESWAIDAVADVIAGWPGVWPWLRPRRDPAAVLSGRRLSMPFRKPIEASFVERSVFLGCDGHRPVQDLTGDPPDPKVVAALIRLQEAGAIRISLRPGLVTWPERELAESIDVIGDDELRKRAHATVQSLVDARERVAAAAGDPERLLAAQRDLSRTFEGLTGAAATRSDGQAYAGRTLVYEDDVRDVRIGIGRDATTALAEPLSLLLDSATWFAETVARRYEERAADLLRRTPDGRAPLLQVLTACFPELAQPSLAPSSDLVEATAAELQAQWLRIVGLQGADPIPDGELRVRGRDIAAEVAAAFGLDGSLRWQAARRHAPDLVPLGDRSAYVLGELHCASDTMETKVCSNQHPEPSRHRQAIAESGLADRILILPSADNVLATTRMAPAEVTMLSEYTYLTIGNPSMPAPPDAAVVSVMDLVAELDGDQVVVRHLTSGRRFPFPEVAGDPLRAHVVSNFAPFRVASYLPRISIDDLVVSRETWVFDAAEQSWVGARDEAVDFARARNWRAEHGLPERVYVRTPLERKPLAVDFRSLPLVNILAKTIRQAAKHDGARITLTEALPDLDHLWLRDAAGKHYSAELRILAVRRSG